MRGMVMTRKIVFAMIALMVVFAAMGGSLKGRLTPFISTPMKQAIVSETLENRGVGNVVFDIQYPKVCGFDDHTFEDSLNERILVQVENAMADAFSQAERDKKWVFVLRVDDEVKCQRGILSLRITDDLNNGGTGFPHTVYYNTDIHKSRFLTLDDLFVSREYQALIDRYIRERIQYDEHYFVDEFMGVATDTSFFISKGQLHIAYAKYEIASGMTGEPDFAIPTLLIRKGLRPEYAPLFW